MTVVAQTPAAAHFAAAKIPVRTVAWPSVKTGAGGDAASLRAHAAALLGEVKPDVVLTGLSTPFDAGIDEAVLDEARVPTFLYQDFGGEQNLILGRGADHILAVDAQAANRNRERFGRDSIIVGSARHAAYAALDIPAARARVRAALGVSGDGPVVGFFGQALHSMPGYRRTVEQVVATLRGLPRTVRLVLRPHPRESESQRRQTREWFEPAGLRIDWLEAGTVEDALVACDVVISLFSTCTFDTAYLNRFSPAPVAVPMSVLFDEEIAAYCRQHGNYLEFSHHTLGLVWPVYAASALPELLASALSADAVHEVWSRAHTHLPDPAGAPRRVLDAIATAITR